MLGEYCLCNSKQFLTFESLEKICDICGLQIFIDPRCGSSKMELCITDDIGRAFKAVFDFDSLERRGVKLIDEVTRTENDIIGYFGMERMFK